MAPDLRAAGKWQISEMKKQFWMLGPVLFTSPASEWHFHLSSSLIGSSAHNPIGASASLHTRSTFTFLTHTHMRHICLHVSAASLYNSSKSWALTCICIFPPLTLSPRPLFKHQNRFEMENMCFHLNKPSKTVLQTLDPSNYFHAQMLSIIIQ